MEPTNDQSTRQRGTFSPDGRDVPAAVLRRRRPRFCSTARRSTLPRRTPRHARWLWLVRSPQAEVRRARIDVAQSHIRSELDDLDRVARAQVLADIARSGLHGSSQTCIVDPRAGGWYWRFLRIRVR
jgi:hypothetical protein